MRLIVNIPMNYTPHNEDGPTGDPQFMESSYYQIPVSADKELNRNTCYEVLVTVNAPGGSNPLKPVELTDIAYSVYDWEKEQINVGGEDNRPAYLTLNEYEMEMHNMEEDNTTLEFASSSEVTAEITKVYYINKFGQEQELKKPITEAIRMNGASKTAGITKTAVRLRLHLMKTSRVISISMVTFQATML